jgi:hypothetical protein
MKFPLSARAFIALVIVLGLCVVGSAIVSANGIYATRFVAFLLMACLAARLKVKLPGLTGSMSVNLPFILVAVAEMSLMEALIVGCISNLVQYLPQTRKKFNPVQAAFNFSTMALAVGTTHLLYGTAAVIKIAPSASLRLAIATAGFFLVNTATVTIVMFLTEGKSVHRTWLELFQLSFPYFLASAGVAGMALTLASRVGWQVPVSILPLMWGLFYSYRRYFASLSQIFADALRKPTHSEEQMAVSGEMRA